MISTFGDGCPAQGLLWRLDDLDGPGPQRPRLERLARRCGQRGAKQNRGAPSLAERPQLGGLQLWKHAPWTKSNSQARSLFVGISWDLGSGSFRAK